MTRAAKKSPKRWTRARLTSELDKHQKRARHGDRAVFLDLDREEAYQIDQFSDAAKLSPFQLRWDVDRAARISLVQAHHALNTLPSMIDAARYLRNSLEISMRRINAHETDIASIAADFSVAFDQTGNNDDSGLMLDLVRLFECLQDVRELSFKLSHEHKLKKYTPPRSDPLRTVFIKQLIERPFYNSENFEGSRNSFLVAAIEDVGFARQFIDLPDFVRRRTAEIDRRAAKGLKPKERQANPLKN